MEKNRRGDHSEILAVAWLWEEGYEVFRNQGCTGKIDLIAVRDDDIILIDVKTCRATADQHGGIQLTSTRSKIKNVKTLYCYKGHFSFKRWDLIDHIDSEDKERLAEKTEVMKTKFAEKSYT